jgi:hypothetical protein
VERRFRESAERKEYEELLLSTPASVPPGDPGLPQEKQAPGMASPPARAATAEPEVQQAESFLAAPKSWDEIELAFLSDEETGTIPRPSAGKDRAMIQKRIEEIREKLRGYFKIEGDPIPFNDNMYQASFKIWNCCWLECRSNASLFSSASERTGH